MDLPLGGKTPSCGPHSIPHPLTELLMPGDLRGEDSFPICMFEIFPPLSSLLTLRGMPFFFQEAFLDCFLCTTSSNEEHVNLY